MAQQKLQSVTKTPTTQQTPAQAQAFQQQQQQAIRPFTATGWTEADYIRALASLERLQSHLDSVRKIPAALIAPFRLSSASTANISTAAEKQSREHAFSQFDVATKDSFAGIQALRKEWDVPDTRTLVQQCMRVPDGGQDAATVIKMGVGIWGWCEREEELSAGARKAASDTGVGTERVRNSLEDEDEVDHLYGEKFAEYDWEHERTKLTVLVKRPGVWLQFEVTKGSAVDGIVYESHCVGEGKECEAISRCLFRREAKSDIYQTVEMLIAYGEVELSRADCGKCGRWRDGTGATPCARRRQSSVKGEDVKIKAEGDAEDKNPKTPPAWIALHEGCL